MPRFEDLPYRPCVGVMVLNRAGLVFIGRRSEGPEHEETSIRSVERLGEINDWLSYDIPRDIVGQAWGGRYRGQTQKWYALRFTGHDSEINISSPGDGVHDPEFIAWKWEPMAHLPDLVVPFKRSTYERVVREFSKFADC